MVFYPSNDTLGQWSEINDTIWRWNLDEGGKELLVLRFMVKIKIHIFFFIDNE